MNKQSLRKEYLTMRDNIPNKEEKSNIIFDKIISLKEYQQAKTIALYKSLSSEVNTGKLIDYSLSIGKTVLLPKVIGNDLVFYEVTNKTIFMKSSFGVYEPMEKNSYDEKIDLIIVPGVCFDKKNNRLGFGKGYYDRFLINNKTKKIGVCFKEQLIDNIPTDKFDIKMDLIVTD